MSSQQDDPFAFFREQAGIEEEPEKERNTGRASVEPEATEDDKPYILPPLRPEKYTALRLGKRRERLLIDRAAAPMRFPAYHELKDISFEQTHQQIFMLFFHEMTVEVNGENLWGVVHAIANGRCAAIYEYHVNLYPAPPEKGEPFIQSIKLVPPLPPTDG